MLLYGFFHRFINLQHGFLRFLIIIIRNPECFSLFLRYVQYDAAIDNVHVIYQNQIGIYL